MSKTHWKRLLMNFFSFLSYFWAKINFIYSRNTIVKKNIINLRANHNQKCGQVLCHSLGKRFNHLMCHWFWISNKYLGKSNWIMKSMPKCLPLMRWAPNPTALFQWLATTYLMISRRSQSLVNCRLNCVLETNDWNERQISLFRRIESIARKTLVVNFNGLTIVLTQRRKRLIGQWYKWSQTMSMTATETTDICGLSSDQTMGRLNNRAFIGSQLREHSLHRY